jgi:hypothetical protein
MQIINANSVEWGGVSGHRYGVIEFKRLLRGKEPQVYELSLVKTSGEYRTPRHRHNYDQVRFGLTGYTNYAPGKDLGPGQIGFFPEGTHYGMQKIVGDPIVMAVQSCGVSGEPFMTYDQLRQGGKELSQRGSFEGDGVYSWVDADGKKHNKDSYEAIWEHVFGRPIHYAPPRYDEPLIMTLEHYTYRPLAAQPGVERRLFGVFTEGQTELAGYRLAPGAQLKLEADGRPVMLFVYSGAIRVAGADWDAQTAIGLDPSEQLIIDSPNGAEAVYFALPRLQG